MMLVPQYFGSVVYDRRTCQYLPFDTEATRLLRTLASVSLAVVLQQPDEARREVILDFFDKCHALGFFTLNDRFAGGVLDVHPPAAISPLR